MDSNLNEFFFIYLIFSNIKYKCVRLMLSKICSFVLLLVPLIRSISIALHMSRFESSMLKSLEHDPQGHKHHHLNTNLLSLNI